MSKTNEFPRSSRFDSTNCNYISRTQKEKNNYFLFTAKRLILCHRDLSVPSLEYRSASRSKIEERSGKLSSIDSIAIPFVSLDRNNTRRRSPRQRNHSCADDQRGGRVERQREKRTITRDHVGLARNSHIDRALRMELANISNHRTTPVVASSLSSQPVSSFACSIP